MQIAHISDDGEQLEYWLVKDENKRYTLYAGQWSDEHVHGEASASDVPKMIFNIMVDYFRPCPFQGIAFMPPIEISFQGATKRIEKSIVKFLQRKRDVLRVTRSFFGERRWHVYPEGKTKRYYESFGISFDGH